LASPAETAARKVGKAVKSKRLSLKSTGDVIGEIALSMGVARFREFEEAPASIARA